MTWMSKLKDSGNIGLIANILAIFLGILVLWTALKSHNITQTKIIANILAEDVRTRLNIYETYVEELKFDDKKVPVLLTINIKELEDQLDSIKNWDTKHE